MTPKRDNRLIAAVTLGAAASAVLFHLITAGFAPQTALIQRPVHLGLMAILGFLGVTIGGGGEFGGLEGK